VTVREVDLAGPRVNRYAHRERELARGLPVPRPAPPLKAVIMNLLSVGAAYGILVAVFQWGWGGNLLGVGPRRCTTGWSPPVCPAATRSRPRPRVPRQVRRAVPGWLVGA
jgi:hypothetical protein